MGIFSSIESTITRLREIARDYVETQIELLKIQAAEKISTLVATVIAYAILSFFLLFFLLFASVALAYVLSDWIGKPYAGFLIVAGLYLLIGFGVFKGRERLLRRPILNAIIRQLFNPGKNKEENKA
jgi:uncharacterized membrane protein YqjE